MSRWLKRITLFFFGLFALLVVASLNFPDENPAVPRHDAGQYLTIDNLQIRYRQEGQGQDLLLIHGLPGAIEDFDPLFAALKGRYRITAYDRPGQGFSSATGAQYSVAHNAYIANQLIQKLQLRNVIVIGHSYGGTTALQMAMDKSPGIRGYVTIAAPGIPDAIKDPLYNIVALPVLGKGVIEASGWAGNALAKHEIASGLRDAFYPNDEYNTENFNNYHEQLWLQPTVTRAIALEILQMNIDLKAMQARYHDINAPVTVIQGEQDKLVNVTHSDYLVSAIPGAQRILLPNTGHYVQFARTNEVVQAIDQQARTVANAAF